MKNDNRFENALEGKKVAPLTLDNKWYKLFKQATKTEEINNLEAQLQDLLKQQGKVNTENVKLKKLKAKLMDEIVAAMEENDKAAAKKKEDNSKLIDEINDKLDANEDSLLDLPREIDIVNRKLMILTMEQCYEVIKSNTTDISELEEWITSTRIELKKSIVRKQEMEIRNVEIYSYMHDIFGADVIELFDIKYDIEGKKQEILARQRAMKESKTKEQEKNG